jgi:GT2 family glycosyltransferase
MNLSIVIPVFNNWAYTKNCINNFIAMQNKHLELIIVDNASTDDTQKYIVDLLDKLPNSQYIRNEKNCGFGAAVNAGINKASSECIMILNNDIRFGDMSLSKLWFINLSAIIKDNDNMLIGPTGGYVDPENNFAFCYETNDPAKTINYMSGWCLAAQKEVWNTLAVPGVSGPFDSNTFFLYFEDSDLGFRAREKNIDFHIISTSLKHIGKQTSKLINTSKYYTESRNHFIKKWKK